MAKKIVNLISSSFLSLPCRRRQRQDDADTAPATQTPCRLMVPRMRDNGDRNRNDDDTTSSTSAGRGLLAGGGAPSRRGQGRRLLTPWPSHGQATPRRRPPTGESGDEEEVGGGF
jgi:hypothetical protein